MILQHKTAIVTGASSGLGYALTKALIQKEVKVYGIARNKEKLEDMQEQFGKQFVPVPMDVTNFPALKTWIEDTFQEETPEILINNAGIGRFEKIDEMASETWFATVDTNLNSVYVMTSEVVKKMKRNNSGKHIINIGSILGTTTRTEAAAYCATKHGINGMSEVLFKELRSDNIKVTCINSGSIATNFFADSGIEAHNNMLHPNEIADTIIHVLETPDNVLINELTVRPLNPRKG